MRRGHARNAPVFSPQYDQIMVYFKICNDALREQNMRDSDCKM